ncbi:citrate/2-methylcitrate synthase [Ornithinibacillus salinisoli]|uniref:Citrate synthase n=1 Tax=Ornithinibacillus salinisoli TaxID=1848459 RepID=A0ABW4W2P0_9BACI
MYQPGLKGIIAAETELSYINGEKGELLYRGIPVHDFVHNYSCEETAFYLLNGRTAHASELANLRSKLIAYRNIPSYVEEIIDVLPRDLSMMDVLRTAISSLEMSRNMKNYEIALNLIAVFPTIIAYRYRSINNLPRIQPASDNLNHVENFMYMLTGEVSKTKAQILEKYLILTMEHGLNASTFAARVTISTESDLVAAITSALGTMKGPLHGGAPTGVINLLEEISSNDRIHEVITTKLANKQRIMGFGHRVYKTVDPRAEALKETILKLDDVPKWIELAMETEQETIKILQQHKPNQQLYTNVEYYAAAIMKTLELDPELFTAIFSSSRIVGWCAHAIEQLDNNILYRPDVKYIGKK